MNLNKLLHWTPRILSLLIILFWLVIFFIYDLGEFITAAIMVWFFLLLVTALAWKTPLLGGSLFIIISLVHLIFVLSSYSLNSLLAASPQFIVGILFTADHFYQKKSIPKNVS